MQGEIEIKAAYVLNQENISESTLQVDIRDTGVGIAEEDLGKLFTRFGKLQRTAEINSEGLGLGLTIVRQIVESAGGAVTVNSAGPDQGSTFSFTMKMEPVEKQSEDEKILAQSGIIFFEQTAEESVESPIARE